MTTQVSGLVRRASNEPVGGLRPIMGRALNIAHLVVALLGRSPRFFAISMRLPMHSNEFVCALCAKLQTDALLPFRADGAASSSSSSSTPLPTNQDVEDVVIVDSDDDDDDDDEYDDDEYDPEVLSRQATLEVPRTAHTGDTSTIHSAENADMISPPEAVHTDVLVIDDDDGDGDDDDSDVVDLTDAQDSQGY